MLTQSQHRAGTTCLRIHPQHRPRLNKLQVWLVKHLACRGGLSSEWHLPQYCTRSDFGRSMILHLLGYDSATASPKSVGTIQSLNVWDPPDFNLLFFWYALHAKLSLTDSYFPPPAPLLSYLLYPSHPFLTPFLHLIITLQTLYLTRHFQQLVKDRQYLTAEVMREYDQRFVYPKVFAMTSDKGVMTHEGKAILKSEAYLPAEVVW